MSTLPLGKDYYRALLKYHTTTNLSPQEVHLIGLKEVTRITGRMETIKDQVGFKGTLSQFRDFLRKDKRFGFLNEAEILSYYRNIETEVRKILPNTLANNRPSRSDLHQFHTILHQQHHSHITTNRHRTAPNLVLSTLIPTNRKQDGSI